MKIMIKLSCLVLTTLLIISSYAFANEAESILNPEGLIKIFYSALGSNKDISEHPEIFSNPASFASVLPDKFKSDKNISDSAIIWKFLKENQKIFSFQSIPISETLDVIRISYLFSNFPENGLFFEGSLSVMLIGTLSKKGKDGIMKEITFSLKKTSGLEQNKYLIDLHSTRINGAFIKPYYSEFRKGEIFQKLGFDQNKD